MQVAKAKAQIISIGNRQLNEDGIFFLEEKQKINENPGTLFTLTHTYKHTRTHAHAYAPTRMDDINKIAEFR